VGVKSALSRDFLESRGRARGTLKRNFFEACSGDPPSSLAFSREKEDGSLFAITSSLLVSFTGRLDCRMATIEG
jgi:hypothetical protein